MKYKWDFIKTKRKEYEGFEEYHPIIHTLLSNLDLKDEEEVEKFLNPKLDDLHDPLLIADIEKVSEFILSAIKDGRKFAIHGDFDVDGIAGTSLLWIYLYRHLGADVIPIIPNRFTEGYGLSEDTIQRVLDENRDIIITVDCGVKDIEIIKKYSDLTFIITDHHTFPTDKAGNKIPPKAENLIGVVHPQNPNGKYPFHQICGATVAWKLVQVLQSKTKIEGYDPMDLIDYVALATSTDIMPFTNENRIIVTEGMKRIQSANSHSLKALLDVAGVKPKDAQTYHLGFAIGPRLNAAGRLYDAIESVRLLSTDSEDYAQKLAKKLNDFNIERQKLTQEYIELAEEQISQFPEDQKLFFIYGEEWPDGILGLIAGKIQEKYNRPILAASISKDGIAKGSARSPSEYDIVLALKEFEHLLVRFGGHTQAAGFTLQQANLEELIESLVNHANENLTEEDLLPKLKISATIELDDISEDVIGTVNLLEPFGFGNPTPKFLIPNLEIIENKTIGRDGTHSKLYLTNGNSKIFALGFNKAEYLENLDPGDIIDIVGNLKINEWNGNRSVQIEIIDVRKVEEEEVNIEIV